MTTTIDLKSMYQMRAEELAERKFGKGFYDLDAGTQDRIYNEAETQVNEELVCSADSLREELELQRMERGK